MRRSGRALLALAALGAVGCARHSPSATLSTTSASSAPALAATLLVAAAGPVASQWSSASGSTPAPAKGPKLAEVAVGGTSTCARTVAGEVFCWGDDYFGQLGLGTSGRGHGTLVPTKIPGLADVVQLAVRATHACARLANGTVRCWGSDADGEAGLGAPRHVVPTPTEVPALRDVVEIALGDAHVCARRKDATVQCWGDGERGQLGDGTHASHASPVSVLDVADAAQIAAGGATTCVRRVDGSAWCWGTNTGGENGDGTPIERARPWFRVGRIDDEIVDLAVGTGHACARTKRDAVWCWGWNRTDDLDPINASMREDGPVRFDDLVGVAQLAPANGYGCFRMKDGTVRCWGIPGQGRLGDGTCEGRLARTAIAGLDHVVDVATAIGHACALRDDAGDTSLWCWGSNANGELGDGTREERPRPTKVAF